MDYFRNKWILVGSLGMVFLFTLIFSYGPGYGGNFLALLGSNTSISPKMSPSDTVTPVVTSKKVVTFKSVTNVTSMSPSLSPTIHNDYGVSIYSQLPTVSPRTSVSPTPLPRTPTMTPTVSPTPLATPSPTATPGPETPLPTPNPTPTPTPVTISAGDVVINEIAWMGTKASQYAEWIELYNTTSNPIDLSGWKIIEGGSGATVVTLANLIQVNNYYLIERVTASSPHAFFDIATNISSSFVGGGLANTGEKLTLQDSEGNIIDIVDGSTQWYGAGVASPDYKSMERIDPYKSGSDSTNWATNNGMTENGHDSDGNLVNGTPALVNSVVVP